MLSSQGAGPSERTQSPGDDVIDKATEILDRPALVAGFSAVPREPKFLGLAG
jgi:hypothetical protein